MSEELEALEALRLIRVYLDTEGEIEMSNELNIIETALERKEWLEFECNGLLGQLEDYKFINEPKLKALEIIKKYIGVYEVYNGYLLTDGNEGITLISKEEFDLLKEVLL